MNEAAAGDDWEALHNGGGSAHDFTGVVPDGAGATVFQGGGSKDDLDISSWQYRATGSVPDKDNITNAYAAAYISTSGDTEGDTIVYFGMDRIDTSGDANMGFWFFQQLISPGSNGRFEGTHTVGDILVQVDYSNGGTVPNVRVLEWVGTGGEINGTLDLLFEGSADCLNPSQDTVCATTNTATIASPWNYIRKGTTTDGPFPPNSFVEGGINISALFGNEEDVPCFASFMAATRASTSVDAVLKDFVIDTFESCGIAITKTCDQGRLNPAGTGFLFDYHITVTNTGGGTLYDVTITDSLAGSTETLPSPLGATPVTIDRTFSSSTNGPFTNTASVTAAAVSGGPVVVSAESSDTCEAAPLNPAITVSKTCSPRLEVVGGRVVVTVDGTGQVCNTGDVALTNVSVTDDCGSATDQTQTIGTLPVADPSATPPETGCRTWSLSCAPNASDPDPSQATFSDGASATGTPALGSTTPVTNSSGTVSCDLCPEPPAPE